MNEFSLIERFFQSIPHHRQDVVFGIGDDAACLQIPAGQQLLISCDTLVADVHFLKTWDAYDIAYKALMVNISDMAAMAAMPCWVTLALTMPVLDESWLQRFSEGFSDVLQQCNIALIGGDTTRGPLALSITIHGLVPAGQAVRRNGAKVGDLVCVTGVLGAAAFAVKHLSANGAFCPHLSAHDTAIVLDKLQHPRARIDFLEYLRTYATSAIDISDGLSADLNHICVASGVGACLESARIPVHPVVLQHEAVSALDFALNGGDDYEICFTVTPKDNASLMADLAANGLSCEVIGVIEETPGLRLRTSNGDVVSLDARGYQHF
jgi:thiamine-monophosphate kinase